MYSAFSVVIRCFFDYNEVNQILALIYTDEQKNLLPAGIKKGAYRIKDENKRKVEILL